VNARDAMPSGGQLTIETGGVVLKEEDCRNLPWAKPGHYGVITVVDTGQGIPPEAREHIFDPFFTTKEIGKGTGLGLSTVFGIVQQHDGFLTVDSEPGKGSTFRVFLPAIEGQPAMSPQEALESARGGDETVLVVEDEPGVQRFATRTLMRGGYRVLAAENGAEALKVLGRDSEKVHLVLLDLIMPGMTGGEVYEHIRREFPRVKIVIATGYSSHLPQDKGSGSPQILHKPYSPEQLMSAVRHALDMPSPG